MSANNRSVPLSQWPSAEEYDRAVLDHAHTMYDPDLRDGELLKDFSGPIKLGGGMVYAYRIGNWAVRCLSGHPPPDLPLRYQHVLAYINAVQQAQPGALSFLVPCAFLERGVQVVGRDWPVIKVPWVQQGVPLGDFLNQHRAEPATMQALKVQFFGLLAELQTAQMAHGDLDLTNILVCGQAPQLSLRLIDFDAMFVPPLAGRPLTEDGHEHFQPPTTGVRRFNAEMDTFSALVIYLAIAALGRDPSLWEACGADESSRLLLDVKDFKDPGISAHVQLLERKGTDEVRVCLGALQQAIAQRVMPPFLAQIVPAPASATDPQAGAANGSRPSDPATPQTPRGPLTVPRPVAPSRPLAPPVPIGGTETQFGAGGKSGLNYIAPTPQAQRQTNAPTAGPAPYWVQPSLGPTGQPAKQSGTSASTVVAWIVTIVIFLVVLFALISVLNH